jgi:peptidoglycan/LPS O-acetylase OafA/YrhL
MNLLIYGNARAASLSPAIGRPPMSASKDFAGPGRLHGLDAVRAFALLLGVLYHATMAYLPGPPIWLVEDPHRSLTLSLAFFVPHMFRMSTFFLIAGFFAHMMVERRGVAGFAKDRAKRILLPLVVGWPFLLAGILGAAAFGAWLATGHVPPPPPRDPHGPPLAFPLTHLWFLYVLLIFYAITLGLRALMLRLDRGGRLAALADRAVAWTVRNPLGLLALASPAAVAFCACGPWIAWLGVPTPDSSLLPNIPALTQYLAAFGFGWLLHRQPRLLDGLGHRWPLSLGVALTATAACLAMLGVAPRLEVAAPGLKTAACAVGYAVGMWSWTFAVIGAGMRFLNRESRARRYVADSSYWIYLMHLPLVILLQALATRLEAPAEVKMALVLAAALALLLASYELMVRHSFIGAILNGRRVQNRPSKALPAVHPEPAE